MSAKIARGLKHIQSPLDICIHIAIRGMVTKWNSNKRSKMEDYIYTFHCLLNTMRIADIPGEHFYFLKFFRRDSIEPAPGIETVIENKCSNLCALIEKRFYQVAANKAIGAGNKNICCR